MFRSIVFTALAVAAAACTNTEVNPLFEGPDAGASMDAMAPPPPDAGVPDLGPPDTGLVDTGVPPDMGTPDTGSTPQRTLVTYSFLGTTPVDNLVMAPFFDTSASIGPAATGGTLTREVRWDTPTRTPALRMQNAEVIMFVQGRPAPLDASIWVGQSAGGAFSPVQISLVGLGTQDLQTGEMLQEEAASEQVIGTLRWRRYAGTISQDLLGNALMFVQPSSPDIYIAGPVVTRLQTKGRFAPETRTFTFSRESRERLRSTWQGWAERAQRQLAPAQPRLRRDAPLPFRAR